LWGLVLGFAVSLWIGSRMRSRAEASLAVRVVNSSRTAVLLQYADRSYAQRVLARVASQAPDVATALLPTESAAVSLFSREGARSVGLILASGWNALRTPRTDHLAAVYKLLHPDLQEATDLQELRGAAIARFMDASSQTQPASRTVARAEAILLVRLRLDSVLGSTSLIATIAAPVACSALLYVYFLRDLHWLVTAGLLAVCACLAFFCAVAAASATLDSARRASLWLLRRQGPYGRWLGDRLTAVQTPTG